MPTAAAFLVTDAKSSLFGLFQNKCVRAVSEALIIVYVHLLNGGKSFSRDDSVFFGAFFLEFLHSPSCFFGNRRRVSFGFGFVRQDFLLVLFRLLRQGQKDHGQLLLGDLPVAVEVAALHDGVLKVDQVLGVVVLRKK